MSAIAMVLAEAGLALAGSLIEKLVPLLGEFLVTALAAKIKRFKEANPALPNVASALNDLQSFANMTAQILDDYDWGTFFSKDEVNRMKFKALRTRLIEKATGEGLQIADNTVNSMINDAVETLRAKILPAGGE